MDKKRIENRDDIELFVNEFYKKVKQDPVIGYIFNDIVNLSWEKHIPVMYNFWETILFGEVSYKGNPISKHIELDKKEKLTEKHFTQWKKLFKETIDTYFEGEKAEEAKSRAETIGRLMLFKIEENRS